MSERVAVVTGGAGPIGGAIVERLHADGFVTVVLDREQCDLADADAVSAAAAGLPQVDVLVHAAAAFDQAALYDVDLGTWHLVQAVNVESVLLLAQAFVPGMRERRWGRIVMVVSDTVWRPPDPQLLAYVTSKAALIGMTRTLALDLGRDGITVNAVAPGSHPDAGRGRRHCRGGVRGRQDPAGASAQPDTGRRQRHRGVPLHRRRRGDHRPDPQRRRRTRLALGRTT
jgi:NAD(P)-dependent dehydrogenase (short-subunit alcohol dehydrogenase family)